MLNRILGAITLGLLLGISSLAAGLPPDAAKSPQKDSQPPKDAKAKVGLSINDPKAFAGYTLLSPISSKKTYLIDMKGRIVRQWAGAANPELCAELLPNGNLLRPCGKETGGFPGTGERFQEFTWDGELVWDFRLPADKYVPHHDVTKMPNGHLLVVTYEQKTAEQCVAAGRKNKAPLESDCILEIKPVGKNGGEIVWEWHIWDHLIQDHDNTKANFGSVAEHPELIDINVGGALAALVGQQRNLPKGKGFAGIPGGNWTHTNAVTYNADLDQIMLSIHGFSEFWIIDHGTTTAQAATSTGGKQGKGGGLLYRWGNPQAYRAGKAEDQRLFGQHNAHWIPKGRPGAGHVLVFNNGLNRQGPAYSSVDEIVLPVDDKGRYAHAAGTAFGPEKAAWSFTAPKKTDFFSMFISSASRQPNGNTLICAGTSGTIFEITAKEELVWKYVNPVKGIPAGKGQGTDLKKADAKDAGAKKAAAALQQLLGGGVNLIAGQWMFRAYRYSPDYPGLAGRTLTPGMTVEESLVQEGKK